MEPRNDKRRLLIENLPDAFAYHQIITDSNGEPADYIILDVNPAFEEMTGLLKKNIIGKNITELLPGIEASGFDWIGTYGKVALTAESIRFEQYSEMTDRWYEIIAYSDEPGFFAVIFRDITFDKNENLALEKLTNLVHRNLQSPVGDLNYQGLTDGLLELSGAKFAAINTYELDGRKTVTRAISGMASSIRKACDMLGFELVGKAWDVIPERLNAIKEGRLLRFENLYDAGSGALPKKASVLLEKAFGTGEIYVAEVDHECKTIGDLIMFMPAGKTLEHPKVIELYVAHIGISLMRGQAEQILNDSEQKYRSLVENVSELIYSLDSQTRITYVSSNIEEIAGYTADELIGKSYIDFVHPKDREGRLEQFQKILSGISEPNEYRFLAKDGREIWVRTSARPMFRDGNLVGIQGVLVDVTECKQVELQLRESENKQKQLAYYHHVLSKASIALTEAASEQEVMEKIAVFMEELSGAFSASVSIYNRVSEELLLSYHTFNAEQSKQVETLLGTKLFSLKYSINEMQQSEMKTTIINKPASITDLTWGTVPQHIADALQAQLGIERITAITLHHDKNILGTATAYLGSNCLDPPDEVLKIFGHMAGLALSRKQAEEALLKSENKLNAAFEGSHDAITIMTIEGELIDCNQRALELYGLSSKEEFMGRGPVDFSPPLQPDGWDSHEISRQYIKEALTKGGFMRFEWLHQRQDGSTFPAEVTLTSYKLGEDVVLQASVSDITERKFHEEKLQYLSMHDVLTGLYNRAFFEEEMRRLSGSREYPVTIVMADMDGLKLINDTMGHTRGDTLLKACAELLQGSLRTYDILARIGGDEFAVLLPRTDEQIGNKILDRIRAFCEGYNREHYELPLSISLGMATAQSVTTSLEDTYKKADDLMYRDKLKRKDMTRARAVDMLLTALAERDYLTTGHGERIAGLCMRIGEKLNLSHQQLIDLALLAQVHDLGKVAVPDEILFKKEPLTDEEWEMMRQHAEKGYHIALSSPDLTEIADLILKHHEHWDGQGYPQGLQGTAIPLECRVFAIADAFDVMTSDRPYRRAKSIEEAAMELKQYSGTQFDPEMMDVSLLILQSLDYQSDTTE